MFRTSLRTISLAVTLTVLSLVAPAIAQQNNAPHPAAPSTQTPAFSAPATTVQAPSSVSSASGPSSTEAAPSPAGDAGANLLEQASPHDLSPWSMFMSADIVVKLVMIGLAFASLVTWTICIAKMVELSLARRNLGAALTQDR